MRKSKPEFARYDSAGFVPCVYVLEVADMVKVGCSRIPAIRLRNLHKLHAKRGQSLGRFCVFPVRRPHHYDKHYAEFYCIQALSAAFTAAPGHREYFTGCDFDSAAKLVETTLATLPA